VHFTCLAIPTRFSKLSFRPPWNSATYCILWYLFGLCTLIRKARLRPVPSIRRVSPNSYSHYIQWDVSFRDHRVYF
jgi:hypothetical protein